MFCLDYAIAFFSHSILCHFLLSPPPPSSKSNSFVHFPLGCAAGVSAACALFPFDIVRMTSSRAFRVLCWNRENVFDFHRT